MDIIVYSKGGKKKIDNEYTGKTVEQLKELYKAAKAARNTAVLKKLQEEAKRIVRKTGKNKISLD